VTDPTDPIADASKADQTGRFKTFCGWLFGAAFGTPPDRYREEELFTSQSGKAIRVFGNPWLLVVLTVISITVMSLLAMQVIKDVRTLRQSATDEIEWSLNEAEVEFLSYTYALRQALHGTENTLVTVRQEFAIFQNRLDYLRYGAVYEPLRNVPGFDEALNRIQEHIEHSRPFLMGSEQAVAVNLRQLEQESIDMAPFVREMAAIGQANLSVLLDRDQIGLSTTLKVMAGTSGLLMTSLVLLAFYFNRLRRLSEARRRSLLSSSKRSRAVLSSSLDAVIVSDADGIIQEYNKAAADIFGYDRDYAIGRTVAELMVPEGHIDAHKRGMKRVKHGGGFHMVGKGRVRMEAKRQDGSQFPIEMALQKSESNGQTLYIAFVRDISYRVRAERELIEARDQALAGEKAKARFLAVMSHEIRTPMNGMLGNMSLLRETKLNDEQQSYLGKMETSGALLLSHVNDVLDIARYEDGKPVVRYRPTKLREVIESAVESQRGAAEERGNTLTLIWSGPSRGWVSTDPGRLQQIILNLLSNAVKFTDDGSIIVDVRCRPDSNDIELRIKDDGIGICATDIDRIFEDFFTHDDSFARKTEGTGLGLGIVRRITEALSGTITAESQLGVGSTFAVRLPMPPSEAPEEPENNRTDLSEAETLEEKDRLSILVVEDNQINRDVVRAMLTREGHQVEEAHDGQSGVELASQKEYDLILMDISMPVLDGREATRAIRAGKGASARSPIVALTAHVLPENVSEFLAMGMQDVLPKPLMRPDLQRIIRDHTDVANSDSCPSSVRENQLRQLVDHPTNIALRESVGEAYDMLLDKMQTELVELNDWLQGGADDLSEIADQCHKFASSAAVFGALPLQKLLVEIELAGKAGSTSKVNRLRQALPQTLKDTLEMLHNEGSVSVKLVP